MRKTTLVGLALLMMTCCFRRDCPEQTRFKNCVEQIHQMRSGPALETACETPDGQAIVKGHYRDYINTALNKKRNQ